MKANHSPNDLSRTLAEVGQELLAKGEIDLAKKLEHAYVDAKYARIEAHTPQGASIAAQAKAPYGRKRRRGRGPDNTQKGAPSRV